MHVALHEFSRLSDCLRVHTVKNQLLLYLYFNWFLAFPLFQKVISIIKGQNLNICVKIILIEYCLFMVYLLLLPLRKFMKVSLVF